MEHDDLALEDVSSGVKKHEPASRSFPENTMDLPRLNRTTFCQGPGKNDYKVGWLLKLLRNFRIAVSVNALAIKDMLKFQAFFPGP
ncbi:MAG TPA: hypothetical protein VE954_08900 [Oligoflexus sp.]|uniref:hypothetical protein n=1 Tax=Oligoflexus sp. TaxID=1971216 RepID=UPI002D295E58|nr:hypothetical protein [Oligoflexus sp.]HYX33221.1 hypothetical protein [Oligoflexus sp.]